MAVDQVAASIFDLFFRHWSQRVAAERFSGDVAALMAGVVGGLAVDLLDKDTSNWFAQADRLPTVVAAFQAALQELEARLGPEMSRWQWGNLHTITLRHPLSGRGELSQLLDRGGYPVGGNGFTVCNTGYDLSGADYQANSGANYRLIADLGGAPQGLWAVDAAGQSGHPGSAHYCDQLSEWLGGQYHFLPLERADLTENASFVLRAQEGLNNRSNPTTAASPNQP
jgi:penicillin amidase